MSIRTHEEQTAWVESVKARLASGTSQRDLAAMFSMAQSSIWAVVAGKTYRDIVA